MGRCKRICSVPFFCFSGLLLERGGQVAPGLAEDGTDELLKAAVTGIPPARILSYSLPDEWPVRPRPATVFPRS